jgi:hypothetical protein
MLPSIRAGVNIVGFEKDGVVYISSDSIDHMLAEIQLQNSQDFNYSPDIDATTKAIRAGIATWKQKCFGK